MKNVISLVMTLLFFSGSLWANEAINAEAIEKTAATANQNEAVETKSSSVTTATAEEINDNTLLSEEERAVDISKNMKIVSQNKHEQDDQTMYYNINIKYPQIKGKNLSAYAQQFNQIVESVVNEETAHFKKLVTMDVPHMKTLPEDVRRNTFTVDYDVDVIKPKNQTIVSVRLSFEGMQAGRAHPYHANRVINFDLATGKVLALDDLFKKNAPFLKLIAAYSNKSLNQKLKNDNWMIAQGTKADPKNFKNWNLQADSILITFDEYQVAPYVYGKQEVEVPYSELTKVLTDSKTPISNCAKNPSSCQVG